MLTCLRNWYNDDREGFLDSMRADLDTVLQTYHFENVIVALNKNFIYDPPMDTISCTIAISDEEDCPCLDYRAIFDFDMNMIDDVID